MKIVTLSLPADMLGRLSSLAGVKETAEEIAKWLDSQGVLSLFIDYDKLQELRGSIRSRIPSVTFITECVPNLYQLAAAELVRATAEKLMNESYQVWTDIQLEGKAVEYLQGFRRFEQLPELVVILSTWAECINVNEYMPWVNKITGRKPKTRENKMLVSTQYEAFPKCATTTLTQAQFEEHIKYRTPSISVETISDEKLDTVHAFCCKIFNLKPNQIQREAMEIIALNDLELEAFLKVMQQMKAENGEVDVTMIQAQMDVWMKEHPTQTDILFCYFSLRAFEYIMNI